MTVWICGNSHTAALRYGQDRLDRRDEQPGPRLGIFGLGSGWFELEPFSELRNGKLRLLPSEYRERFKQATGRRHFVTDAVWGLCMGTHNARIYRDLFWCGAAPMNLGIESRRPVSRGFLDAIIERDQQHIRAFLLQLQSTGVRMFVVSCPPVRLDHPSFNKGVDPRVAVAIDLRARELFRDFLKAHSIGYVNYPPETGSGDGFLLPRYAQESVAGARDAHHANHKYGAIMVQRIRTWLLKNGYVDEAGQSEPPPPSGDQTADDRAEQASP